MPKDPLPTYWAFNGHGYRVALGYDPVPVHYWLERLVKPELEGKGFTCTDHGVTQGFFMRQLLKSPLSETVTGFVEFKVD